MRGNSRYFLPPAVTAPCNNNYFLQLLFYTATTWELAGMESAEKRNWWSVWKCQPCVPRFILRNERKIFAHYAKTLSNRQRWHQSQDSSYEIAHDVKYSYENSVHARRISKSIFTLLKLNKLQRNCGVILDRKVFKFWKAKQFFLTIKIKISLKIRLKAL